MVSKLFARFELSDALRPRQQNPKVIYKTSFKIFPANKKTATHFPACCGLIKV
jgi:hypothetical protein